MRSSFCRRRLLTASGVKVPYTSTSGGVVSLTANITSSKPAGGNVTFFVDGNNGFTVSSPAVNGIAQFQFTGLSVGVHTVTASYSGDANTLSSPPKGSLNIAVTGQAGITVQANTGGLSHSFGINITLQQDHVTGTALTSDLTIQYRAVLPLTAKCAPPASSNERSANYTAARGLCLASPTQKPTSASSTAYSPI